MDKFLLIDGNNLLFRSFYALPQLSNFQGEISNAVFGFANALIKSIKEYQPKYIAVAFDKGKQTFRHKEYAEYKAQRNPTPKELLSQIPIAKDMLQKMNIKVLELDELEADDIIGCLSRSFDTENIILSADKDLLQLINQKTYVITPKKGNHDPEKVGASELKEKYGIEPFQIVDLKSLMGDASDNIPGVTKVGEKTALGLLEKYQTLNGVYEHIDEIKGKLQENLIQDKENAYLSYHLATIVTDKDLGYKLEDFTYDFPFNDEVLQIFKRYQFNILLNKKELFVGEVKVENKKVEIHQVKDLDDLKNILMENSGRKEFSFHCDHSIHFAFGEEGAYVISLNGDMFSYHFELKDVLNCFKPLFENSNMTIITQDVKALKTKLIEYGLRVECHYVDIMIARYLINSNSKSNITLEQVAIENGLEGSIATNLFVLRNIYFNKLKEMDLMSLYTDMELPLVDVLYEMEQNGFKLDRQALIDTNRLLCDKISVIENKIQDCAGRKFNINSPKQLGEILFTELNLPTTNNKKRSTGVDVLNALIGVHPIIELILDYRTLYKLYSGYVNAFMDMLDEEDKIHTVFNQTLTTTGRLSSSEPNLQNIPVRSEEGRELRKLFVSRFDDGMIMSADYSQVELRLVAHLSQEPHLIDAYQKGLDIHASTASQIFDIPLEEVDSKHRRDAKAINFGIIYGISEFGLAQNIGRSKAEASAFIKKYFEEYPNIKSYMESNVAYCKEHGYVKTLFGRIRPIPEINNSNYMLRMFGERAAMNMPLQGTASDIIKLAMIKVFEKVKELNLKSKLIVQVHDELVVDCPAGEVEIVAKILKECMENVVKLDVPLLVDINYGKTWYEAK